MIIFVFIVLIILICVLVLRINKIIKKHKYLKNQYLNLYEDKKNLALLLDDSKKTHETLISKNISQNIPSNVDEITKIFSFKGPALGDTIICNKSVVKKDNILEIDGIKFSSWTAWGLSEIFGRKDYEFGGLKDCIFIDVGANTADSTLYVASLNCIAYVYAYEPFKATYEVAKKNISLNPELESKIHLLNYGWSNETSLLEAIVIWNSGATNSINNHFIDIYSSSNKIDIGTKTKEMLEIKESKTELLSIIKKHTNQPIILKMDIEGSEYDCLENIADVLSYVDILIIEWHFQGYKSITEQLEKYNFVWFNECLAPEVGLIRAYNRNKKNMNRN